MASIGKKRKLSEIDKNVPMPAREKSIRIAKRSRLEDVKVYDHKFDLKAKENVRDDKTAYFKPYVDDNNKDKVPAESKLPDLPRNSLDSHEDSDDFDSDSTLKDGDSTVEIDGDSYLGDTSSCVETDDGLESEASTQIESIISDQEIKEASLWFSVQYIEDIITHELEKQSHYRISDNYCVKYEINSSRREILVEWLIDVQVSLKVGNNTIHLAVALLDILLDRMFVPCAELQAAAIAAFWVACKFVHGALEVDVMTDLCAGAVTKSMILKYEILVLKKSNQMQTGGDVLVFFNYLLYKCYGPKFPPEIYYCGQYILEIMLLSFTFVGYTPSQRAAIALVAAQRLIATDFPCNNINVSRFISKSYLRSSIKPVFGVIKDFYKDESDLKDSAVYKKYKLSRYCRISLHQSFKKLLVGS